MDAKDTWKALGHLFYEKAVICFDLMRKRQILKGQEEYGQPYDPANFTPDEQLEHFMSELPDIMHYGYGMYETMKRYEKENWELKEKVEELLFRIHELEK